MRQLHYFLTLSLLVAGCSEDALHPDQHNEGKYGVREVVLADPLDTSVNGPGPWSQFQKDNLLRDYPSRMSRLGRTYHLTDNPGGGTAWLKIRRYLGNCEQEYERYDVGSDTCQINADCLGTDGILESAEHCTEHREGMQHIRLNSLDPVTNSDGTPVLYDDRVTAGRAIANARLGEANSEGIIVYITYPTTKDMELFRILYP